MFADEDVFSKRYYWREHNIMTKDNTENKNQAIKKCAREIGKGVASIGKNSLYFTLGLGVETVRTANKAVKKLGAKLVPQSDLDNERLWYALGGYDSYDDDGKSYCRTVVEKASSLEIEVGHIQLQGAVVIYVCCSKEEANSLAKALNTDPASFEVVGKNTARMIRKENPFMNV